MRRSLIIVVAGLVLLPLVATAQSPNVCAPTQRMDKYRFLRQLMLDLYGRVPTIEEYEALHDVDDVSEAQVDEILASDEFFDRLADYHRGFLWTTLPNNDSVFRQVLEREDVDGQDVWMIENKQRDFRGAYEPCLNVEHTNFGGDGRPLPMQTGYAEGDCANAAEGCTMDGWVVVDPYWAPETSLRVCAFDAQEFATGLVDEGDGPSDCSYRNNDPGCGCGPNLLFCAAEGDEGNIDELRRALTEEPSRIFEGIIRSGLPYMDAFSTNQTYFNGALRHYYRYLQRDNDGELSNLDAPDYNADWELVDRPDYHAGVLTTMGYLLRHTSQRARINRLYTAFLCDPFVAPAGGLPPATDPCSQDPDLSSRCGCATCHQTIEPAATYFGRWREADFEYRADLETFRQSCAECEPGDCSNGCIRDYITRELETTPGSVDSELGKLKTVAWRTPEQAAAIDRGPSGLFEQDGMRDRLASCAVQNFAEFVLHRELTTNEKGSWLADHVGRFASNGYDFIAMVKAIVTDERYRKVE